MINNIQPHLSPFSLIDINKKLIPTELNSSYSIGEIIIITSVNNITTSIQPYLFYPLININKKSIPSEFNFPSGIKATTTLFSISAPNQFLFFSASTNKDPTYLSNINTLFIYSRVENKLTQDYFKGELSISSIATQLLPFKSLTDKDNKTKTLPRLTLVAPVKDYILQLIVFSLTIKALVKDVILQLIAFNLAKAFKHLKVYISNQFIFLQKKTNSYKDFINMFLITAKLYLNNY